ncbi:FIG01423360: glycoside hydrolase [hydrothermal vent metagenome]|uniref:FIG01423360: glycoside hydrolase n=1 Tax=hydrothermal vent metagenome TaxID=652676 RepID=A0A3B0SXE0_9ZZZZ
MYWGELFVNLALSENGIDWEPILNDKGELLHVFKPSLNEFDSHLTEPGPPAFYTENRILLLYNGKNLQGEGASTEFAEGTYCGGQVLFDKNAPTKLLSRMKEPFICPRLRERKSSYDLSESHLPERAGRGKTKTIENKLR